MGTQQLGEISLADFFPGNGLCLAGGEIGYALFYLVIPCDDNLLIHLAAQIRDQGFG